MMRGMFAAISGLRTHQVMMDVTANDIANANTIGYKSARATFKDSLAQMQRGAAAPGGAQGGANAAQVGLGVQLGSIDNQMGGGALQNTGGTFDVAVQGDGMFVISNSADLSGARAFTRAGNFTTNANGDLITQEGSYVVGFTATGTPPQASTTPGKINVPDGATSISISQDGAVSYIDPTTKERSVAGYMQLARFANPAGLERSSGNQWIESPNSGAAQISQAGGEAGKTMSGMVEMSNVDLAAAFTNMITAQRGFQASSRVISTSDEMLQDLVNIKR
jgi:flagellar hook protein FlgE